MCRITDKRSKSIQGIIFHYLGNLIFIINICNRPKISRCIVCLGLYGDLVSLQLHRDAGLSLVSKTCAL